MRVRLIEWPAHGEGACKMAAALCTGSDGPARALRSAMSMGHESVIEHASFTFLVEGVSRVLLAQLTRHRLASYSVESQRYCGINEDMVIPPVIDADPEKRELFLRHARKAFELYDRYVASGVEPEDARYCIPEGVRCNLVMTMNARELRHFLSLRMCGKAQWEIRELAQRVFVLAEGKAPNLFRNAGPGCVRGTCPEGRHSCGHPVTDETLEAMRLCYGGDWPHDPE